MATGLVTRDQAGAMTVPEQVVLTSAARSEQTGTPEEVYQKPPASFVYGYAACRSAWGSGPT
ncbi:MAG: hypothetical protein IT305_15250 [Chloroflexi bacterium]|nr:hypothetical protein [Chloroflexota bacterium]